jgi:3-oxoacyl-[acyl-carrier protein] reductase
MGHTWVAGMLSDKVAVIYGGGGVLGAAAARAFARAGASVYLAGRSRAKLDAVASEIEAYGGRAATEVVDALDLDAVQAHADRVVQRSGRIDIVLNAVGIAHVQGVPLAQLGIEDFFHPVATYIRTSYIIAKATAQPMMARRSGVLLLVTTPAGRMAGPGFLGHSVACAGVEAMTRHLAGEVGASGVRVVCLRSHAIPQTVALGSHAREVFGEVAAREGASVESMLEGAAQSTLLGRLPSLDQFASTAVFLASDAAGAITGAVANLTCGFTLD